MTFLEGKTYVCAFEKPWYVTISMIQAWAKDLGIELVGLWPIGHKNSPTVEPQNTKPYTHLLAGMVKATKDLELTSQIAWVVEFQEYATPFLLQRTR